AVAPLLLCEEGNASPTTFSNCHTSRIMMARGGRIEIPNKNNRAADPAGICLRRVWFDVVRTDGVKIERAGLHGRQPIDETGELPRVHLGQLWLGHDILTEGTVAQPT